MKIVWIIKILVYANYTMVYERSGKYEKSKEHFWQTFFDNTNTLFIYSSDMCYCYVVDN